METGELGGTQKDEEESRKRRKTRMGTGRLGGIQKDEEPSGRKQHKREQAGWEKYRRAKKCAERDREHKSE